MSRERIEDFVVSNLDSRSTRTGRMARNELRASAHSKCTGGVEIVESRIILGRIDYNYLARKLID